MHATVFSGCIFGIEGLTVEVEVDLARGIPAFSIVGLPNTAVRESRERVTAAIKNTGIDFPLERITVNLAPADIKKEGAAFDLAIALGIVVAAAQKKDTSRRWSRLEKTIFLGELALDGTVRRVRGVLPVLLHARSHGFDRAVIPRENFSESGVVEGIEVFAASHLRDALAVCAGGAEAVESGRLLYKGRREVRSHGAPVRQPDDDGRDMSDVVGQETVKRALLVAAAGGHHVLMIGPPGAGKTMLARRFHTILPPLDERAALETTMIYSTVGLLDGRGLVTRSPFRAPHHSASDAGLIGGGNVPRPGEVTLAHNGVLFLDELPEFRRHVLETLREPLEAGRITISRARSALTFPARFQLVAAMNPCPCGNAGSPDHICRCTPLHVERYRGKISGPLLDRIAIHVYVHPVDLEAFDRKSGGESSRSMIARVLAARRTQRKRAGGSIEAALNARLPARRLGEWCRLDGDAGPLLARAQKKLRISARGRAHVLRVARTIADLEGAERIGAAHIAEAVQYRMRELGE